MRNCLIGVLATALLSMGCGRPDVYIRTQAPHGTHLSFRSGGWVVMPLQKVASNPVYEKAIVGLFGSEEAFKERFAQDLQSVLPQAAVSPSSAFRLELGEIVITERLTLENSIDVPSISKRLDSQKSIDVPLFFEYEKLSGVGSQESLPTPYCSIALEFRVIGAHGKVLIDGVVQEETASDSWVRPYEARLRNALNLVRNRLLEYLSGRMSARHVAPLEG